MNTIDNDKVEQVKNTFKTALSNALDNNADLSKKDLAKHVGVSVNTIRNILKGENFNFKVAIKVDLALDLGFFTTTDEVTSETTEVPELVEEVAV